MTDDKSLSGDENARGRKRMGDDGGSRVGRPDAAKSSAGPSTRPVSEGLEGAILDNATTTRGASEKPSTRASKPTGAGSEATRGEHGAKGTDRSSGSGTEGSEGGAGSSRGNANRSGSEPLEKKSEHKGSYGGEGGVPRK